MNTQAPDISGISPRLGCGPLNAALKQQIQKHVKQKRHVNQVHRPEKCRFFLSALLPFIHLDGCSVSL